MTQTDTNDLSGTAKPQRRWQNPLTWSVLLAAGILVYELTAQPGLGAAVLCIKFGWNDLLTAFWLRRIDGRRARAGTCFWLYVASALWKIAITGTALMFAVPIFSGILNPAPPGPGGVRPKGGNHLPPEFLVAVLTTFFGFSLSGLTTVVAIWRAWRQGIRLWLHASVQRARRSNVWPALVAQYGAQNKVGRLVLTALLGAYAVLLLTGIILLVAFKPVKGHEILLISFFVLLFLGGGPFTILILRDFLHRKVYASSPFDCWGHEEWNEAYLDALEKQYRRAYRGADF
jgi:hypothetical protein